MELADSQNEINLNIFFFIGLLSHHTDHSSSSLHSKEPNMLRQCGGASTGWRVLKSCSFQQPHGRGMSAHRGRLFTVRASAGSADRRGKVHLSVRRHVWCPFTFKHFSETTESKQDANKRLKQDVVQMDMLILAWGELLLLERDSNPQIVQNTLRNSFGRTHCSTAPVQPPLGLADCCGLEFKSQLLSCNHPLHGTLKSQRTASLKTHGSCGLHPCTCTRLAQKTFTFCFDVELWLRFSKCLMVDWREGMVLSV